MKKFKEIESKRQSLSNFIKSLMAQSFGGFDLRTTIRTQAGIVDIELCQWAIDVEGKDIVLEFSSLKDS